MIEIDLAARRRAMTASARYALIAVTRDERYAQQRARSGCCSVARSSSSCYVIAYASSRRRGAQRRAACCCASAYDNITLYAPRNITLIIVTFFFVAPAYGVAA